MAWEDKNILITPNVGSTSNVPKIEFTGATSTEADTITLNTNIVAGVANLTISGSNGDIIRLDNNANRVTIDELRVGNFSGTFPSTSTGTVLRGVVAEHAMENQGFIDPASYNVLAGADKKYTVTTTINGLTVSNSGSQFLGDSNPSQYTLATSTTPLVIEITDVNATTYSAIVGITFGSGSFRARDVKIETFRNGAWQTECDITNGTENTIVRPVAGNNANGVTAVRYTLKNPNNVSGAVRINNLFLVAYNTNRLNYGYDWNRFGPTTAYSTVNMTDTTASTSTTTGSMTLAGGLGVAGAIHSGSLTASSIDSPDINSSSTISVVTVSPDTTNSLFVGNANDQFADLLLTDDGGSIVVRNNRGDFQLYVDGDANSTSTANSALALTISGTSLAATFEGTVSTQLVSNGTYDFLEFDDDTTNYIDGSNKTVLSSISDIVLHSNANAGGGGKFKFATGEIGALTYPMIIQPSGAMSLLGTATVEGLQANGISTFSPDSTYVLFEKPTGAGFQTVAGFGSGSTGTLFLTTQNAHISSNVYYNNGWTSTATYGSAIDLEYSNGGMRLFGFTGQSANTDVSGAFTSFITCENNGDVAIARKLSSKNATVITLADGDAGLAIDRASATGRSQIAFRDEGSINLWRFGLTGPGSTSFAFFDGVQNALELSYQTNAATFSGRVNAESLELESSAAPYIYFGELDQDPDVWWRQVLDAGNLRFDISTSGLNSFTTYQEVLRMKSNGNVGIGEVDPAFKLHVRNNGAGDGTFTGGVLIENDNATAGEPALAIRNTSLGSEYWFVGLNQDDELSFSYGETFVDDNSRMNLLPTGNVGIGERVPLAKLHVKDETDLSMNVNGTGQATIQGNGYRLGFALDAEAAHIYHNSNVRDLILGTNELGHIRIKGSNGNTGIGRGNILVEPDSQFHVFDIGNSGVSDVLTIETYRGDVGASVAGSAIVFKNSDTNSAGQSRIKVGSENSTNTLGLNEECSQSFIFEVGRQTSAANTTSISVDSDNIVTVSHGTASFTVGQKIAIIGGAFASSYTVISVPSNTQFLARPTNTNVVGTTTDTTARLIQTTVQSDAMTIRADGNVGIGTTSPDHLLHLYKTNTSNTNPHILIDGPSNTERAIIFADDASDKWWMGRDNTGTVASGFGWYNHTLGKFAAYFEDAGDFTVDENIRITSGHDIIYADNSTPALRTRATAVGVNDTTYTTVFTCDGNGYGSALQVNFSGTSNNVVVAVTAYIIVNHSQDIFIRTDSGFYTPLAIRITSDNNDNFALEIKHGQATSSSTNIAVEVHPQGNEAITFTGSHSFVGNSLEHITEYGTKQSGSGGGNATFKTDGQLISGTSIVSGTTVSATKNYTYGGANYHYILEENSGNSFIGNVNGSLVASSGGYYYGAELRQMNPSATAYSAMNLRETGEIRFEQITGATGGTQVTTAVPFRIDATGNAIFTGTISANSLSLPSNGRVTAEVYDNSTGQEVIITGGESYTAITNGSGGSLTGEIVYVVAEGGLQVISHPNNWNDGASNFYTATAWSQRNTATINDAAGNSSFPGSITASGNVSAFSDVRLKTDIETLDGSKVYDMRGVSFIKDGQSGSGVIAQELEEVAPELVQDGEYKSVSYGNLVGYLIEAVKDQKKEIDELKAMVKHLLEKQ